MSKFPPRPVIIHNPEVKVSDDINEKFILALKTGNLDQIRDFILKNKIKLNLVQPETKKTPAHIILELDNKIADPAEKLRILKYLAQMEAPLDLPDKDNVWPIHLASASQDEDLIDFFLKKGVQITSLDASGNTPLHYATMGRSMECPNPSGTSPGSLVPSQPTDKLPFSQSLNEISSELMKLIGNEPTLTGDVMNIINTLMKIPEMYAGTDKQELVETSVINAFSTVALDPTYSGSLSKQVTTLEQLTDTIYDAVKNDIGSALDPLSIKPSQGGWGPTVGGVAPVAIDKILPVNIDDKLISIQTQLNEDKKAITTKSDTSVSNIVEKIIPAVLTQLDDKYLKPIIFTTGNVIFEKIMYVLLQNHYRDQEVFIDKTIDAMISSNKVASRTNLGLDPYTVLGDYDRGYIVYSTLSQTLRTTAIPPHYTDVTNSLRSVLTRLPPPIEALDDCPKNNFNFNTVLNNVLDHQIKDFLESPDYEDLKELFDEMKGIRFNETMQAKNICQTIIDLHTTASSGTRDSYLATNQILSMTTTSLGRGVPALTNDYFKFNTVSDRANVSSDITYKTMFIMFDCIHQILENINGIHQYTINEYVPFYNLPLDKLEDAVDDVYSRFNPEPLDLIFIEKFLYRHFVVEYKKVLKICLDNVFDKFNKRLPTATGSIYDDFVVGQGLGADVTAILTQLTPFTEFQLCMAILPEQINTGEEGEFSKIFGKNDTLDEDHPLVKLFTKFIGDYIDGNGNDFILEVIGHLSRNVDFANISDWPIIHKAYQETSLYYETNDVGQYEDLIMNTDVKKIVKAYFDNTNFVEKIMKLIHGLQRTSVIDEYFDRLNANQISKTWYYQYYYSDLLLKIYHGMIDTVGYFNSIKKIYDDITTELNNNFYYFIPQIYLPALIAQILEIIDIMLLYNVQFTDEQYLPLIDTSILPATHPVIKMLAIGGEIKGFINDQMMLIYGNLLTCVKYHNSVIVYLNKVSAQQLTATPFVGTNIFTNNLIQIEDFPTDFTDNSLKIKNILEKYRFTNNTYHSAGTNPNPSYPGNFFIVNHGTNKFDFYRNIINLERVGTFSNSPIIGDNYQINIEIIPGAPTYQFNDIVPIIGQILSNGYQFLDGFIGFNSVAYVLTLTNGMPPSIRSLLPDHLLIVKQRIIQTLIQYIIDNNTTTTKDLYEKINKLGTDNTFNAVSQVKNYVVIGKLADVIINQFMEVAIRESVTDWIYSYAKRNSTYQSLIKGGKITLMKKADYLKMSLQLSTADFEDLINSSLNVLSMKTTQIELHPDKLSFTTNPIGADSNLMHYLYDFNFFSENNPEGSKSCFELNIDAVSKLVSSATINKPNADRQTPLHYAVEMQHEQLIQLLIKRGATPKSFANRNKQTPFQLQVDMLTRHLNVLPGSNLQSIVNSFSTPFNNLLQVRVKDERYQNNIIKNITLAIPIEFCIYNHMFYTFMNNYRHGMDKKTKDDMYSLLKEYYGFTEIPLYPTDLFDITDNATLKAVLQDTTPETTAKVSINATNSKKLKRVTQQLSEIVNQLAGLNAEKQTQTDPAQLAFIDDVIAQLVLRQVVLETEISKLKYEPIQETESYMLAFYTGTVDRNIKPMAQRNLNIIDFYNQAFNKISNSPAVQQKIWSQYMKRDIKNTPSMIFVLINDMLQKIVIMLLEPNVKPTIKTQLKIILEFMSKVKSYIDTKSGLPSNLDDNYVLKEEVDHIVYLLDLILSKATLSIIISHVYDGLKELDGNAVLTSDPHQLITDIMATEYEGQTIESYIKTVLPYKMVKYFSLIWENGMDKDKKITSGADLFTPILNTLKANKVIKLDDNSIVIQNIRNNIIPFLVNNYQVLIFHLRLSIYGYDRYLLNTYQMVKILDMMLN